MLKENPSKLIVLILCVVIALLSFFVVARVAENPENYTKTIASIDEKKEVVTGVTASAAAVSTGLAAIPGDATTPIANQVMSITKSLLIVVCMLVFEKSMLTVFGMLSFRILIPLACLCFAVAYLANRPRMRVWAAKLAVFAIVLALIIPFGMKISDKVFEINETEVSSLVTEAENIANDNESSSDQSWWKSIVNQIENASDNAAEKAKSILNQFIDTVALFIIAYCAVPVIVFLFLLWFIQVLFNLNVPLPEGVKGKLPHKRKSEPMEVVEVTAQEEIYRE